MAEINQENMNVENDATAGSLETSATTTTEESTPKAEGLETTVEGETSDTNGGTRREYTDLEKAQYSFHKQFNRQKSKYERMLDEMRKERDSWKDRAENPLKYKPKTREDFSLDKGGDDAYINYLVGEKMNQILQQREEEYNRYMAAEQERIEEEKELREYADQNINKLFTTPEARKDFNEKVRFAINKDGLNAELDDEKNSVVANFILRSPAGPKLLYELATNKQARENLFSNNYNEKVLEMKLHELVYNIINKPTIQPTIQKPVGRPGMAQNITKRPWDTKEGLMKLAGVR